jgi:DNA-binding NtrC family response regulator
MSLQGSGNDASAVELPRVILIDDEPDLLEVLAEELAEAGFEVTSAASGRDAVLAATRMKFDVAITDLKMPEMDGLQTAAELKKIDPDLPIVMVTGYASEAVMLASSTRQVLEGLLMKPFVLEQVLELLDRIVHPKNSMQQPRQQP